MNDLAENSPVHLRWVADKLQGQLDLQETIQEGIEKKALRALGWLVAGVTVTTTLIPNVSIPTTVVPWVVGLTVVVAATCLAAVVVYAGSCMRTTNYWREDNDEWSESDEALVTRTTIVSLQKAINDRRKELNKKGFWALLTQIGSVVTIVLVVSALLLRG